MPLDSIRRDSTTTWDYKTGTWLVERAELSIHQESLIGILELQRDSLRQLVVIKNERIVNKDDQITNLEKQVSKLDTLNTTKDGLILIKEEEIKDIKKERRYERGIVIIIIITLLLI